MTAERWARVSRLFHRAAALPPERRAELLRRACAGDNDLRREVESLLASHEHPVAFLEQPALGRSFKVEPAKLLPTPADDALLGRRIGPYRLDRQIGAGGMGSVYLASRQDGLLSHSVAIKVIHPWRGSRERLARFHREAQALATLNHPHIARLHDAGVTEDGLPYLIMEHVEGRHIDAYCDAERLDVRRRLELFCLVARAVHFAHQSLVIHRDLKPANILVTAEGVPKLVDFGIAVILEPSPAPRQPAEALAEVLTLDYASPEQLRGGAVTTATDVYSLGVVLYELLCGCAPHGRGPERLERLERLEPLERLDRLRRYGGDGDLERPSDRAAADGAAQRRTTPSALRRQLRGDLDAVALMAMREDPSRRYASAQQLADELDRHLGSLPVVARADTLAYRARKFIRRNRLVVTASVLLACATGAGSAAIAWQAEVAATERDTAQKARQQAAAEAEHARIEAQSAQQLAELLVDSLLVAAPRRGQAELRRIRAMLEREVERVRRQYAQQAHLRANLLDALGSVHLHLDLLDRADELIAEAAELRRAEFGERSLEAALSHNSFGESRYRRGDYEGAAASFRRALELQRALPPGVHTDVARAANNLAVALRALGRADEAEALHAEALAGRRRDLGEAHPLVAESLNNLAAIRMAQGDLETAESHVRRALEIRRASLGEQHPLVGQTLNNLAAIALRAGRLDDAAAAMRKSVEVYRSLDGTDPEGLASTLTNWAELLRLQGKTAAARDAVQEALQLHRQRGEDHPKVASTLVVLANLEHALDRGDLALRYCAEALRIRREVLPPGHPAIGSVLNDYGRILLAAGNPAAAEPLLREAVEVFAAAPSAEHAFLAAAQSNLGACLLARRAFAEAETLLLAARAGLAGFAGGDRAARNAQHLRELYVAWGKPEKAAELDGK